MAMLSSLDPHRHNMLDRTRDDYAIRAINIGKAFPQYSSLIGMATEFITGEYAQPPRWVLKDISFEIARGEVVGIVGSNGAGKSTLLKILAGLLDATTGTVDIRGRLSAILELGTGFDGNYTGRENVITGGMCLGMSREEVEAKLPWIIDFSGLHAVIDEPFRTYSSGMQARLTFATAICIDPDILIVDEALAAGDSYFVHKCMRRIREICQSGSTVLFVSHSSQLVAQLCTTAIWLENGTIREIGPAREISKQYDYDVHLRISEGIGQLVEVADDIADEHLNSSPLVASAESRHSAVDQQRLQKVFRKGPPIIEQVRFYGADGKNRRTFYTWEPLTVEVRYSCPADSIPLGTLGLAVAFERESDLSLIFQISTVNHDGKEATPYHEASFRKPARTNGVIYARFPQLQVLNGIFLVSVGIIPNTPGAQDFFEYRHRVYQINVLTTGHPSGAAFYPIVEWDHGAEIQ